MKFTSQDEADQSAMDTMSIAFDMTGKEMILHVADGDKQANEMVYEIALGGKTNAVKYIKNANSNAFKKDKKTKKATIIEEAFNMITFIELFGFDDRYTGSCPVGETVMRYKKCEDEVSELFGDVYVYELVGSFEGFETETDTDESYGYIWVDKDTGVWVRTLDADGEEVYAIQELELDDVKMPVYK